MTTLCSTSFPLHHAVLVSPPPATSAKLTSLISCSHTAHLLINAELSRFFPRFLCISASHLDSPPPQLECQTSGEPLFVVMLSQQAFGALLDKDLIGVSEDEQRENLSTLFIPPCLGVFEVDFTGFRLISSHLTRYVVLQEAMSWLSTLGGGFSSLGDKFEDAVGYFKV